MSSVSPSSSASRQGVEGSITDAVVGIDVCGSIKAVESLLSMGGLTPAESAAMVKQILAGYHAYLRCTGKLSGSTSSAVSTVVSGTSRASSTEMRAGYGEKGKRVSRARMSSNWRASATVGVADVGRVRQTAPGYCYSKLLRPGAVEKVTAELGSYPSVYSVMSLERTCLLPDSELEKVDYTLQGGVVHLTAEKGAGNFIPEMRRVARVFRPAVPEGVESFWHMLRSSSGEGKPSLDGSHSVGAPADEDVLPLFSSSRVAGAQSTWQAELAVAAEDRNFPAVYLMRPGSHVLSRDVVLRFRGVDAGGTRRYLSAVLHLMRQEIDLGCSAAGEISVPAGTSLTVLSSFFDMLAHFGVQNCSDHWSRFQMPDVGGVVPMMCKAQYPMCFVRVSIGPTHVDAKPHISRICSEAYQKGLVVAAVHSVGGMEMIVNASGDDANALKKMQEFLGKHGVSQLGDREFAMQ